METEPIDLRDYLSLLWRRKGTIILVAVLTTAVALAYSFSRSPSYTSSAEVIVFPASFASGVPSGAFTVINMTTEEQVANSPQVSRLAERQLGSLEGSAREVTATPVAGAETLIFTADAPTPQAAQAIARAYSEAYLELRRDNIIEALEDARDPLQEQIDTIDEELEETTEQLETADESERELLTAEYTALLTQRVSAATRLNDLVEPESIVVGRVLGEADLPIEPSSPNPARDGLLGLVVGLALGMGLAFVRERLDEPVRGRGELELRAGAPVLGFIPSAGWERSLRTRGHLTEEAEEAFKALRVRLLHAVSQRDVVSIAISSCFPGEGKTSVTANLGVALALAGKRTVILSADLRRPRLETYFPASDDEGLAEVLKRKRLPRKSISATYVENLWVLHAGRDLGSVDPSELLGSESMRRLLASLGEFADFVLLDTPPLLSTPDVVSLAPLIDSVLLVVDPHLAQQQAVDQARQELQLMDVPVLGIVVNKHDPSRFRAVGSSYYSYSYGDDHKPGTSGARPLRAIPTGSPEQPAPPTGGDDGETVDLSQPREQG